MDNGQIPVGWKMIKLIDFANIVMGQSPPSKAYNQVGEGIPFFQGKADFNSKNHCPVIRQWTSQITKVAPENSILFTVRAPVGDVILNNVKACIGRGLASIEAKNGGSNQFLFFYLQYIGDQFEKYAQGSTFTAINSTELKNYEINVPSLPEQTRIANILSKVDEEIEKVEQVIEQTEKLKKGLMQKLLTKGIGHKKFKKTELGEIPEEWEINKLSGISDVIDSLHKTPEFSETGFAMVRVTDIKPGFLALNKAQKVTEEVFEKFTSKYRPQQNDVVMSRVGSYGIVSYVNTNEPFCMGQNTVVIHPSIDSEYLFYYLNCKKVKDIIEGEVAGSGYKSLSLKSIRDLKIATPSLTEQRQIAQILSSIDNQISINQQIKSQLQKLKKGLMNDLLSGRVRVNN